MCDLAENLRILGVHFFDEVHDDLSETLAFMKLLVAVLTLNCFLALKLPIAIKLLNVAVFEHHVDGLVQW